MLFRQLEYFVAVAKERHFARAAEACYVSQPALSASIAKLERELNVTLINRGHNYEGLTPEGERLVVWAKRILAEQEAFKAEVAAVQSGITGTLRLGTETHGIDNRGPSGGRVLRCAPPGQGAGRNPVVDDGAVARAIRTAVSGRPVSTSTSRRPCSARSSTRRLAARRCARPPRERPAKVLFDVRIEDQDHSARLLREGAVMGAVTTERTPVPGRRVLPLGVIRYVPVAAPAYAERYLSDGFTPEAVAIAPSLAWNRDDALQDMLVRRAFRRVIARSVHYVPTAEGFGAAVRAGLGWGMFPEQLAALADGSFVRISDLHLDVPLFWQCWKVDSPLVKTITDIVRLAAASLYRHRK